MQSDSDTSDSQGNDTTKLLPDECSDKSTRAKFKCENDLSSSSESVRFDTNMIKTSTMVGLTRTWGGRRSQPELSRMRRARSWSGGIQDDVSSEIRILRERLLRTQTRPRPRALRFLSRRQRFTLASLALVDFMSFCSMSIMAPFFPREATLKGLSDTTCGLVFSFYAIIMFLTSPFFGKFLPRVGTKFMFLSGMFIAGACNVIFGTLAMIEDTQMFTILCFVVRGLEALGASAYSTASFVFVVNAFPESIGAVLGILEMFVGLGMSVGPAIGGFLYSIGGFGVPFYTLGIVMVITIPINYFLLDHSDEFVPGRKTGSILRLFKIPSIIITGMVIVIVSNTWAFLDPTLEPHLRQFNLSTEQIGLIFLLFSGLYGIFSLIWGWVADRVHNHWCMMVWGLLLSTVGLILLGPCPFIPGLPTSLWLDLVALSILGISVALTLLPTFQGVLASSIFEGGCPEALATYSTVAGVWSCCYSLGEVLGPALGGTLAERYGFPLVATLSGVACFFMALITLIFFSIRESCKVHQTWESVSDSIPYSDSTWTSNLFCKTRSAPDCSVSESSPLLTPYTCSSPNGQYETTPQKHFRLMRSKNKSGAASISDVLSYFLKFEYLTNGFARLRFILSKKKKVENEPLYQNYLNDENIINSQPESNGFNKDEICENGIMIPKHQVHEIGEEDQYFSFLENVIFGSPSNMEPVELNHLFVKKNNRGLVPKLLTCADTRRTSEEILRHNLEKVLFYEQNPQCGVLDDVFEGCECRDDVTFVRGTVGLSSTGACEV